MPYVEEEVYAPKFTKKRINCHGNANIQTMLLSRPVRILLSAADADARSIDLPFFQSST